MGLALLLLVLATSSAAHLIQPTAGNAPATAPQTIASGQPVISLWNSALASGNMTSPSLLPGNMLTFSVNITGAPEFDFYWFNLEYHPRIVQFLDANLEGTILWPDILIQLVSGDTPGVVVVVVRGTRTASGNGVLLFTRFRILETGLSLLSVTDSSLGLGQVPITHQSQGGCFNNRTPKSPTIDFSNSPTPGYFETSEYMIGSIAVGIILPESNGPRYNWTDGEVAQTLNGIKTAMSWWASQEPSAKMSFTYDEHIRVPTVYEPVEMPLGQDYVWIGDVMNQLAYGNDAYSATIAYNNAIRNQYRTNWAFTIFVADSNPNVNQGLFLGGGYAYAYSGGPWITMSRYSTWAYNSGEYFTAVPAHETGHIFRATDEYDFIPQTEGYLWLPDADGSFGIMNQNDLKPSVSTKAQMGLVDCDADGVMDLLDTLPALAIDSPLGKVTQASISITGKSLVVPSPNYRPGGRDLTVGTIAKVEFSVDQGPLTLATATDGSFDEALEDFYLNLTGLPIGTHTVTVKAVNSEGNSNLTSFTVNVALRGDVNGDCTVNVSDLARVGAAFLKAAGQPGFDPDADLNQDGVINVQDLAIVGSEFLKSC